MIVPPPSPLRGSFNAVRSGGPTTRDQVRARESTALTILREDQDPSVSRELAEEFSVAWLGGGGCWRVGSGCSRAQHMVSRATTKRVCSVGEAIWRTCAPACWPRLRCEARRLLQELGSTCALEAGRHANASGARLLGSFPPFVDDGPMPQLPDATMADTADICARGSSAPPADHASDAEPHAR